MGIIDRIKKILHLGEEAKESKEPGFVKERATAKEIEKYFELQARRLARKTPEIEPKFPGEKSWFTKMIREGARTKRAVRTAASRRRRSIAQKRTWAKTDLTECPNCGTGFNADHYRNICPDCHYDLKTGIIHEKPVALKEGAIKKVQANVYGAFIMVIAAMCSLVIPPIFAFPTLTYLAIGLFFAAAYVLFPGQRQVLASIGPHEGLGAKAGWLMAKSFLKIASFGFIIYQFWTLNGLIALIVGFLFYFSMPTTYKTTRPWKAIEAWIRMILGAFLALTFWLTFGQGTPVGNSLFCMGLAFFVTLPVQIGGDEDERSFIKIEFKGKWGKLQRPLEHLEKILFSVLMLAGLLTFTIPYGGLIPDISDINVLMFLSVWGLSLLMGLSAGPGARPPIGAIMIMVSLFVFAGTYTGYIGQAIFGYWWPQVQSFTETYLGPLGNMWAQAQGGLSDTWLILTNPQQYYLLMQQRQQVTKSVITTGGTPLSIELAKFELQPSIRGILEPSEPVIGIMELHNKGDFTSEDINLDLSIVRVNATELIEYPTGDISDLYCSNIPPYGTSSSGNPAYCYWTGDTYPTEMRSITFKLEEGPEWEQLFTQCTDNTVGSSCTCFDGCNLGSGNITYDYGGTSVKVYANLTYDYIVNVSMPINVIGFNLYLNKLQAGEIVLQDLTSEYTGGPAKATLWTPKQPARTDIPFLVVASIYNDGSGELLEITNFRITVYGKNVIDSVRVIGSTFRESKPEDVAIPDGCDSGNITPSDGNFVINCEHTYPSLSDVNYARGTIKPGEWKRVSFYIDAIDDITDERTTQIVGWADYTYRKTTSQTLTMANAPPQ